MSREGKGLFFKGKIYLRVKSLDFQDLIGFFLEMMCSFNYTLLKWYWNKYQRIFLLWSLQTSTTNEGGGVWKEKDMWEFRVIYLKSRECGYASLYFLPRWGLRWWRERYQTSFSSVTASGPGCWVPRRAPFLHVLVDNEIHSFPSPWLVCQYAGALYQKRLPCENLSMTTNFKTHVG